MSSRTITATIIWQGITIKIDYEAEWLRPRDDCDLAHVQVEAIRPERAALPITETGFKSHFTAHQMVTAHGGPVEYVTAWLDHEAGKRAWKNRQPEQFSLF